MADKPRVLMHKVRTEDIIENFDNVFSDVKEAGLDPDNNIVKGVCLFGRAVSKNNDRTYLNKAIDSLTTLAEGTHCYLDHPQRSELKERDGVRSIRDFAGVFRNARRQGEKVFADLYTRESYWPLFSDLATLNPLGCGLSINARVKVYQDEAGKENVADVDSLRSADLVSSAATTQNLFESAMEKNIDPNIEILKDLAEQKIDEIFTREGIIQDQLDNDKIKRELSDITYTANRLIEDTIYDDKISINDKKKKVMSIFTDLDSEVKKKLKGIKENLNMEDRMNQEEILKIQEAAIEEYKQSEAVQRMETDLTGAKDKVTKLEENMKETAEANGTKIKELEEKVSSLGKENQTLKLKLDEKELVEKRADKKATIEKLIEESKLSKDAVTPIFMDTLMGLEEKEEEDKTVTVEEQVKAYIEDRKAVVAKTPVTGAGDEHDMKAVTEGDKDKAVTDKDVDDFAKKQKK